MTSLSSSKLGKSTSTTSDKSSKHCGNTSCVPIWRSELLAWPKFSIWDTLLMSGGVCVDPAKIQVIQDFPTPTTLTELCSYGYCQFLPHVHVVILSYHLALESSHQGRSESKILLVRTLKEGVHRIEKSPLFYASTHFTRLATAIWDQDRCLWLCYWGSSYSTGTSSGIS